MFKEEIDRPHHDKKPDTDKEAVDHPQHYGGADNPYEAIKVIEAWELNFNLGNTVKYISRYRYKKLPIEDLEKAVWYLNREINNLNIMKNRKNNCKEVDNT